MNPASFRTRLIRPEGTGTWTFAMVPVPVAKRLGLGPRMRVVGTIDGAPFRSSLIPRGGGRLFVVVPSGLRDRIGKSSGQTVEVALSRDARPLVIRVPPDLRRALGAARRAFDGLAPSHRRAFVEWITSAKGTATRERRVAQTVAMVRQGRTLH